MIHFLMNCTMYNCIVFFMLDQNQLITTKVTDFDSGRICNLNGIALYVV